MQALDLRDPPLSGTQLIEASAGTGKTYTLAALYLHLLLSGRRVEQILVMTFTRAATAELHARIRASLRATLQAFSSGSSADPVQQALLARYPEHPQAAWRLRYALRSFEQAAIYTIHGFCQRVLSDFPLATGHPPGSTKREDEAAAKRAIAEDFWRREVVGVHPLLATHLLSAKPKKLLPEELLAVIAGQLQPYDTVRTAVPPPLAPLWEQVCACYIRTQQAYQLSPALPAALLAAAGGLNQQSYKPKSLQAALQALAALLSETTPPASYQKKINLLGYTSLLSKVTKKATPALYTCLQQPLWAQLDTLLQAYAALTNALEAHQWWLLAQLREYCLTELPARGRRLQEFGFDDLPRVFSSALNGVQGTQLAARLRARYPVALVDEFQDTDGEQLRILTALYVQQPATALYLVGDPKQAIYRFRGADLYSYLKARNLASAQYQLQANYRATPLLVAGLNALYCAQSDPFAQADIQYYPVQAGRTTAAGDPAEPAPWQLWWLTRTAEQKPLTKGEASARVLVKLADEIAALLTQGRIEARAVTGSDIAVLVRTHRQADAVRAALAARGIASAQLGAVSVFSSREAEAVAQWLHALLDPAREDVVKGVLVGSFYRLNAAELAALTDNSPAWEQYLEHFWADHATWQRQGFMAMFHTWLWRVKIAAHLLSLPEGERRLTNLLHLAELLHQQAHQHNLGPHALLRWLQVQRQAVQQAARAGQEAHELRLESDAHRVRILTLHRCKGLEFNLVFCPLLWDEGERKGSRAYHEAAPNYRSVLDLTCDELPDSVAAETQAEFTRLVYVALTRAKQRCYLSLGVINQCETSALWRLFQPWLGDSGGSDSDTKRVQRLRSLSASTAPGSWEITLLPQEFTATHTASPVSSDTTPLQALLWNRTLSPGWWVTSFSALLDPDALPLDTLLPEALWEPPAPPAVANQPAWEDIHQFPRGRFTGTCWHKLLELLDFNGTTPGYRSIQVSRALVKGGFAPAWNPAVTRMLDVLLDTPRPEADGLRLSQLPAAHVVRELEFHLGGGRLNPTQLTQLFTAQGYPELAVRGDVEADWGVLHGFIDLIIQHAGRFYLGDYKSNWLGSDASAYASALLLPVLRSEGYTLQALLYTLALHRYLRLRIADYAYERHYGGMWFFFLRGLSATDPTQGVVLLRPDLRVIEALDAHFSPA